MGQNKLDAINSIQNSEMERCQTRISVSEPDNGIWIDCYFFQIEECGVGLQCPFLHRKLPNGICKLHMFGLCQPLLNTTCGKHHVSPCMLPVPTMQEQKRIKSVMRRKETRLVNNEVATDIKNVINNLTSGREQKFKCLDCEMVMTTLMCLEIHLNSDKHWKTVSNLVSEKIELKGVLGSLMNQYCLICNLRVPPLLMEVHIRGYLHKNLVECRDGWSMKKHSSYISQAINKKVEGYIHINRVPGSVPYETFYRFCSQFGKILKLSLLPSSSGEQHAYLRHSTKPEQDFAQSKLKELQGLRFVGINWNGSSDSFIRDEKDYRRVGTHHGGKLVERF